MPICSIKILFSRFAYFASPLAPSAPPPRPSYFIQSPPLATSSFTPPPPPPTSFVVDLDCRDRLAMSGNHDSYSTCKKVDFDSQRPICALRGLDDEQILSAYVRISGASQVHCVDGITTTYIILNEKITCVYLHIRNKLYIKIALTFCTIGCFSYH